MIRNAKSDKEMGQSHHPEADLSGIPCPFPDLRQGKSVDVNDGVADVIN
jgi:hypothetical protein